jgi:hypothetical protein
MHAWWPHQIVVDILSTIFIFMHVHIFSSFQNACVPHHLPVHSLHHRSLCCHTNPAPFSPPSLVIVLCVSSIHSLPLGYGFKRRTPAPPAHCPRECTSFALPLPFLIGKDLGLVLMRMSLVVVEKCSKTQVVCYVLLLVLCA